MISGRIPSTICGKVPQSKKSGWVQSTCQSWWLMFPFSFMNGASHRGFAWTLLTGQKIPSFAWRKVFLMIGQLMTMFIPSSWNHRASTTWRTCCSDSPTNTSTFRNLLTRPNCFLEWLVSWSIMTTLSLLFFSSSNFLAEKVMPRMRTLS